jgi:small subunit ribosomal protein S13
MVQKAEHQQQKEERVALIRILGKDLRGDKKLESGLTNIKGISWPLANAICKLLELDGNKKIMDLTEKEIGTIEEFAKNMEGIPAFLKNRQKDFDNGENKHLLGADLRLRLEFDIKRLKKIKSYKGTRHAAGLPVRGQRTKANFRRNRKKSGAVGVKKKK